MHVQDIMTAPVISVAEDTSIAEAARLMLQHRISGLPVCKSQGALVGIVTEGDLLRRAETGTEKRHGRWMQFLLSPGRLAAEYTDAHARKVGEVMSSDVITIGPDEPVAEAVARMEHRHIKRLPVVKGGKLVGIVSRANLVRALIVALTTKGTEKATLSDDQIRDHIRAEIDKEPWGPRFSVDVLAKDGIVLLRGSITDERERIALKVAAENTPGVKAVRDELVWIEPTSGFVLPAA